MAEESAGKLLGQVLGAAGVERVGHQAGVVEAGERDAVAGERHHVELGVLHDLEHARVLKDRLQKIERRADRQLRAGTLADEIELVGGAMGERHVKGMPRPKRQRHANELTLHRI